MSSSNQFTASFKSPAIRASWESFHAKNPTASYSDWIASLVATSRLVATFAQENKVLKARPSAPATPTYRPAHSQDWLDAREDLKEMNAMLDKFEAWVKENGPAAVVAAMADNAGEHLNFKQKLILNLVKEDAITAQNAIFANVYEAFHP